MNHVGNLPSVENQAFGIGTRGIQCSHCLHLQCFTVVCMHYTWPYFNVNGKKAGLSVSLKMKLRIKTVLVHIWNSAQTHNILGSLNPIIKWSNGMVYKSRAHDFFLKEGLLLSRLTVDDGWQRAAVLAMWCVLKILQKAPELHCQIQK